MYDIDGIRPTASAILDDIQKFESFCMGELAMSPQDFRNINQYLSVGAVLMIGKNRHENKEDGVHLIWEGLDGREHDLGLVSDAKVIRDYPGFHKTRSHALGKDNVVSDDVEKVMGRRGTYTIVTLSDGSQGIGPNYNMALRNASLKMHLSQSFNRASLSYYWNAIWGNA